MAFARPIIELSRIFRTYVMAERPNTVLSDVSMSLSAGQTCAILGASGSGKSSLLNILGLLDRPSSGEVRFDGRNIASCSREELALIRNRHIGFVFQNFHLLARMDAVDNVALPMLYRGYSWDCARDAAKKGLAEVGLADRCHYKPADLSGGQRQRVAIARALIGRPAVVLADEPTGNLDGVAASRVIDLLLSLNRESGAALVVVTHDEELAGAMQRCLRISHGQVMEQQLSRDRAV